MKKISSKMLYVKDSSKTNLLENSDSSEESQDEVTDQANKED